MEEEFSSTIENGTASNKLAIQRYVAQQGDIGQTTHLPRLLPPGSRRAGAASTETVPKVPAIEGEWVLSLALRDKKETSGAPQK